MAAGLALQAIAIGWLAAVEEGEQNASPSRSRSGWIDSLGVRPAEDSAVVEQELGNHRLEPGGIVQACPIRRTG